MPLYDYRCAACDHQFSELLKHDAPNPPCPHCKSEKTERELSAPGFQLKGTGWYATDFSGKKPNKGTPPKSDAQS